VLTQAVARKCYLLQVEDTSEQDMDTVVSVHNTMNEKTWQQIQMWENIDGVDPGDGTGKHSYLAPLLVHRAVYSSCIVTPPVRACS
jgi:Cytochrome c/c1 heme lyase